MSKQVVKNYSFNAGARTVTLTDFSAGQPVRLERLALITNTTTNQVLYNFADSTIATAAISSNNVITLSTLPGGVNSTDKLRIDYNIISGDPAYDTVGQTVISDGTNIVNVLKADGTAAGQNSQLIARSHLAVAFTTTTAQAVGATDVANYSSVAVHITSQGGSSTVTFQGSNDNVNWVSVALLLSSAFGQTTPTSTATVANVLYSGSLNFRYFRLNVTGIVSGTTAGVIEFLTSSYAANTSTVGSSAATGSAAPTNAFLVGAINTSGNLAGVHVADQDALAIAGPMASGSMAYNGSTWDRGRSASAASATTGTGLLGAGILGYDGTNYQRLKTDTAGVASVTATPATSGGLLVATGSIGNTVTAIKASAGQVYGWYFYNNNATVSYVQFFNSATGSVTLGTTAPVFSLGIPAFSGANVFLPVGITHGAAITIAITTTRAGSTSPTVTVDYNVFYA